MRAEEVGRAMGQAPSETTTMTEIDQEEIEAGVEQFQELYRKQYLATKLRQRLGRDEPIESLDMDVCSRMLAVLQEAEIDLSEGQRERDDNGQFK